MGLGFKISEFYFEFFMLKGFDELEFYFECFMLKGFNISKF